MKSKKYILSISILLVLAFGCKDKIYNGTCTVFGTITHYKNIRLALYEITPSQNYLISRIDIKSGGKFKVKFTAKEKSIYGITNGLSFIYFINDVPELGIETSEDEFENYFIEDSPESDELRQLVATDKKLATEVTLAEKLLMTKMFNSNAKFGYNPEMLDLENKSDKRALELRTYVVNYMDTVHDKLLAIAASNFLVMNEEFNYLELFYKKIENINISKRQKEDFKNELYKIQQSYRSIEPVTSIVALDRNKKQKTIDSLRGKYVFINIWATWCYQSRLQIPFIKKVYEKYKSDSAIEFINVAIDDNFSDWNNFLVKEKYDMKYHLCDTLGKDALILKRFGIDYVPCNFLLDKGGNIITSNLKDDNSMLTIDSVLRSKK